MDDALCRQGREGWGRQGHQVNHDSSRDLRKRTIRKAKYERGVLGESAASEKSWTHLGAGF